MADLLGRWPAAFLWVLLVQLCQIKSVSGSPACDGSCSRIGSVAVGGHIRALLQLEIQQEPAETGKIALAEGQDKTGLDTETRKQVACYIKQELEQIMTPDHKPEVMNLNATCAVVSSSGALLHHEHGNDINSHDVIVRFNGAPTRGYEEKVGNRTDVRLGWSFGEFDGDATIFRNRPERVGKHFKGILRTLYPNKGGGKSTGHSEKATSGFLGMMLSLFHCGSIDAYEMAPSFYAPTSRYSYYLAGGKLKADENSFHGFLNAEHDLWKRLSVSSEAEIMSSGKAHYAGFSSLQCPPFVPSPMPLGFVAEAEEIA